MEHDRAVPLRIYTDLQEPAGAANLLSYVKQLTQRLIGRRYVKTVTISLQSREVPVQLRRPTFLRWIEEAEGRQLREWALLEPDAPTPRVAPQPPIAAAVLAYCAVARVLPVRPPPAK